MSDEKESWAIVELMGHVTMAGRLTEEERFGAKMGRVDIPSKEDGFTTVYFGGSSVYRISPVSEAVARAKARSHQPKPVYVWELPTATSEEDRPKAIAGPVEFEPEEGDWDHNPGDIQ